MPEADSYHKLRSPQPIPPDELCSCVTAPPIKLMCALSSTPVQCMDCNLEGPPETLAISPQLAEAISVWRDLHDAIYGLWLDSGEYEAWALGQLSDITSAVNERGRIVQRDLNQTRRCDFWYFQDQSTEEYEPIWICPARQAPLLIYPHGIFVQRVCEPCSIVTVGE